MTKVVSPSSLHRRIVNSSMAVPGQQAPESLVTQDGLPLQLPGRNEDPLFTRNIINVDQPEIKIQPSEVFSVMTYNILAQCHLLKQDANYDYSDRAHKNMEYRRSRILEEIKHFDADIVCLQEVDVEFYQDKLKETMKRLGYEGLFFKRVGDNYPEGAATFYKTDQFELVLNENATYTELAHKEIDSTDQSEQVKQSLKSHTDKEAVLMACRFTHKSTGKDVIIGNTHLTWGWFKDIDVSCVQATTAFKMLGRLSGPDKVPIIFVGDYNTLSSDPAYRLITEGCLHEQSLKRLQSLKTVNLPDGGRQALVDLLEGGFEHQVKGIRSSYLTVQGAEPEVTSKNYLMNHSVDYMWYTDQVIPLAVAEVNKIIHKMPNIIYPSDHVSLWAKYAFK